MMTDAERLEEIEEIIDELIQRSGSEPIIVEGPRDVKALRSLGIKGLVKSINTGNSIINYCEALSAEHGRFIIMTDWDRKGGHLAKLLKKGFEASDAKYDDTPRRKIVNLTKKDVKDIEGLPSYVDRLRRAVNNKYSDRYRKNYRHKG